MMIVVEIVVLEIKDHVVAVAVTQLAQVLVTDLVAMHVLAVREHVKALVLDVMAAVQMIAPVYVLILVLVHVVDLVAMVVVITVVVDASDNAHLFVRMVVRHVHLAQKYVLVLVTISVKILAKMHAQLVVI